MKSRITRVLISLILISLVFAPYGRVEAITKTGVVDVGKTVLNVRSGPGTNYSKIGALKDKAAVTVYSFKRGWAEIKFGQKKGYVSDDYLKFYSLMPESTAKALVTSADQTQRLTWEKDYTLSQIHAIMAPKFTKSFINRYLKQQFRTAGKSKSGTPLFHVIETEIWGLALYPLDWNPVDGSKKPMVSHYIKKGIEYLAVSQYHVGEMSENKTTTILFVKNGANWLVYDHTVSY